MDKHPGDVVDPCEDRIHDRVGNVMGGPDGVFRVDRDAQIGKVT